MKMPSPAPSTRSRYLGLVRPRTDGGYIVVALVGSPEDATLDAALGKAREHLKVD